MIIIPAGAAHADPAYTAFTVDGSPRDPGFTRDDVYENSQVSVQVGSANSSIEFSGAVTDGTPTGGEDLQLTVNQGKALGLGNLAVGPSGDLSATLTSGSNGGCTSVSGSVNVTEFGTDSSTGLINVFAASYGLFCIDDNNAIITGELRWNSTQGYDAVATAPRNWDFGYQLVGGSDIAKKFSFVNQGANPVTYAGATLVSPTGSTSTWFAITGNTCSGKTIAPGTSCTVTVTPRPKAVSASTSTYDETTATLELATTTTAVPTRLVALSVIGSDRPAVVAMAGPQRVSLSWGTLPAMQESQVTGVNIYRGASPSTLTYFRHVSSSYSSTTDTSVTAGHSYYYAFKPTITGATGDLTPVIAARPWPKYQAGMYHRLSVPVRFVSQHRVVAGHPYTLYIDGHHGVPGSHVAAVALNLTALHPSASTSVTAYPYGTSKPAQPDLVLRSGVTRSNFAIVKVGTGGRIRIATAHGSTPVTVDVTGYYSAAGLSTTYGTGGASQTFSQQVTVLDTKADGLGALPYGYYANVPVIFDPTFAPHVTSLMVEITAYGSRGSGTLTAFATGGKPSGTSALAYSAGTVTTNYAIVHVGHEWLDNVNEPSISILNRGSHAVQLIVTLVGYYDDNTLIFGERYFPTAPVHLSMSNPLHTNSLRTLSPGAHANAWTVGMNLHVSASAPTATTTIKIWPKGLGVGTPVHGQLHAPEHVSTLASFVAPVGASNQMYLRNVSGTTTSYVWSFGRFDAYPQPSTYNYASTTGGGSAADALPRAARSAARMVRLQ